MALAWPTGVVALLAAWFYGRLARHIDAEEDAEATMPDGRIWPTL